VKWNFIDWQSTSAHCIYWRNYFTFFIALLLLRKSQVGEHSTTLI
jgi:hypothetical protein